MFGEGQLRDSLEQRLAACEAAQTLSGRLASLNEVTLVQNLSVLEGHEQDFPFGLSVRVVQKLYLVRLRRLLAVGPQQEHPGLVQAGSLPDFVSQFEFWGNERGPTSYKSAMTPENPSFRPLYIELETRFEEVVPADAKDDDDDDFEKLMKQQRDMEQKAKETTPEEAAAEQEAKQLTADVQAFVLCKASRGEVSVQVYSLCLCLAVSLREAGQ